MPEHVLRSAVDAVDGSRHRHRDVPNCSCHCEAAYVAFWLRLLKNSEDGTGYEIKEFVGRRVRNFIAGNGSFLDHCCVTEFRKEFFNSLSQNRTFDVAGFPSANQPDNGAGRG
ncbi:MAG: hypothetical protein V3U93_09615 [Alphaproteobacteria bacterium]